MNLYKYWIIKYHNYNNIKNMIQRKVLTKYNFIIC